MADQNPPQSPTPQSPAPVQFDQVEYEGEQQPGKTSQACAACQQPLVDQYYSVNGTLICPKCRDEALIHFDADKPASRFFRALGLGIAAAIAGSLIWYLIRWATNYEIGLIAIVAGFMVGAAVRKGSRMRGGWLYQLMAMGLTYLAICATYIPDLVQAMNEEAAQGAAATEMPMWFVAIFASVFSLAAPILIGMQHPISLLIYGFAIYEAWKMNKRVDIRFEGPFTLGQANPQTELSPPPA